MKLVLIFVFILSSCSSTERSNNLRFSNKRKVHFNQYTDGICYGGYSDCAPHEYSRRW